MTDNEVEVDIVGECDVETSYQATDSYHGVDLYAETIDLLPHFTTDSWAPEQVWSLDDGSDAKSEACGQLTASCAGRRRKHVGETHRKPWNDTEKEAFNAAVEIYGRSWSNVSKYVGTRTTLQVKNYACQLLRHQTPRPTPVEDKPRNDGRTEEERASSVSLAEIVRLDKQTDTSDYEDVDIEELQENLSNDDVTVRPIADEEEITPLKGTLEEDPGNPATFHGIAVPTEETLLDRAAITDAEKKVHGEFFEGRQQKTPERYLKIRNYILDRWQNCRPHYLKKTSVRTGLKNCGDVNCIGRIHTYLEQIGAINFGCEQTTYSRPLVFNVRSGTSGKDGARHQPVPALTCRSDATRKRKPKLRDGAFAGGYTIHHGRGGDVVDVVRVADSHRKRTLPKDPFRLVPCAQFTQDFPAPFSLAVNAQALIVMDVHAHSSRLEVIGLLGGRHDAGTLQVTVAEPCESLSSTGLECEMDAVSQTQACESLQRRGYRVVGWYHSHPTFAPNPSLRDLETQQNFQNWFGKGGSPFVGVIVSPFLLAPDEALTSSSSRPSAVRYLIVGDGGRPYRFEATVRHRGQSFDEALSQIWNLVRGRTGPFKDVHPSHLEKVLESTQHIMSSAGMDPETCGKINERLKRILTSARSSDYYNAADWSQDLLLDDAGYPDESRPFKLEETRED